MEVSYRMDGWWMGEEIKSEGEPVIGPQAATVLDECFISITIPLVGYLLSPSRRLTFEPVSQAGLSPGDNPWHCVSVVSLLRSLRRWNSQVASFVSAAVFRGVLGHAGRLMCCQSRSVLSWVRRAWPLPEQRCDPWHSRVTCRNRVFFQCPAHELNVSVSLRIIHILVIINKKN